MAKYKVQVGNKKIRVDANNDRDAIRLARDTYRYQLPPGHKLLEHLDHLAANIISVN